MLIENKNTATNATALAIITALAILGAAHALEMPFMKEAPDHGKLEASASAAMKKACHGYADQVSGALMQAGVRAQRIQNSHAYDHCLRQKLG